MLRNRLMFVLGLLIVASMVLAACQPATETPPTVVETQPPATEVATPEVPAGPTTTRHGGWLDMIVVIEEPSDSAAIRRLEAGEIDIYAYTVAKADLLATVQASENLTYLRSFGSYNELTFNPVGPTFTATGKLNPFSVAKIREATNWLIDRDYIAQEVTGGMAIPRFFAIAPTFADYARYADICAQWEAYYAYNKEKATGIITTEMETLGATLENGKWMFNGEAVTVTLLIRTEDERRQIGDYFANELESIGFTADRQYKTSAEAAPIWQGNPNDGLWHVYTGGWISTAVPRSEAYNFGDFYTMDGWPGNPLWDAYVNDPVFYDVAAVKLYNDQFVNMDERRALFEQAIPLSMQDSVRIWTSNRASFAPMRKEVSVVGDLAGSVAGSRLWPYTIRRIGEEGGALTMAMPSILTNPWNPIGGSNWIYDQALTRATSDWGTMTDPWTGLLRPQRVESAEIYAKEGLPIASTLDWVTLSFVPENVVPTDAWADWNVETQTFITVGEKFPEGVTANIKSVAVYPADLWNVTWHDGSSIDIADFVIGLILTFDRANEASAVYDPAAATTLRTFLSTFKGFKIASEDPLTIEYYTDAWQLDAENCVISYWPVYGYGPASWHSLSVGLLAEAANELAFTQAKSKTLEVEWMNFISGPSLAILKTHLDAAVANNYIPYAPTLGQWITTDEATARWANYAEWYRTKGHFWLGTGPYYIERAFPVEGMVVLKNYTAFVDLADRWSFAFPGQPKIPVVDVAGPAEVKIGSEAKFDVTLTFDNAPYMLADIASVSYLVFGATGELVFKGTADAVADGSYTITLTAEQTALLTAGSTKLTVVTVSAVESIPVFTSLEFVTSAP